MASLDNMPPHEIRCEVCSALVLNVEHGLSHIRQKHPSYYMSHVLPALKRKRELQMQAVRISIQQYVSKILKERWIEKQRNLPAVQIQKLQTELETIVKKLERLKALEQDYTRFV